MDIVALLEDKSVKAIEKRERLAGALQSGEVGVKDIAGLPLDEKKAGIVLEAMEAVSRTDAAPVDSAWLDCAEPYIASPSNSLKREASRVVGNIAHLFPGRLDTAIPKLLENAGDGGTVVRWGSAYALGRIVAMPSFAQSELYGTVEALAAKETENGVKNQYLAGLKKAAKERQLP